MAPRQIPRCLERKPSRRRKCLGKIQKRRSRKKPSAENVLMVTYWRGGEQKLHALLRRCSSWNSLQFVGLRWKMSLAVERGEKSALLTHTNVLRACVSLSLRAHFAPFHVCLVNMHHPTTKRSHRELVCSEKRCNPRSVVISQNRKTYTQLGKSLPVACNHCALL